MKKIDIFLKGADVTLDTQQQRAERIDIIKACAIVGTICGGILDFGASKAGFYSGVYATTVLGILGTGGGFVMDSMNRGYKKLTK